MCSTPRDVVSDYTLADTYWQSYIMQSSAADLQLQFNEGERVSTPAHLLLPAGTCHN
jgi:hypothetical protein